MKKLVTIATVIFAALITNAQGNNPPGQNSNIDYQAIYNICAAIFVVFLFMVFILAILKWILEYRLKNKIVDKGIPENIASSILQTSNRENRHANIKWFALLAGIGAGLTLVNYTLPLGVHSLAIMTFSISLSFLGYFFYLKQSGN